MLFPVDGDQDVSLTPLLEIDGFTDPDTDDDHGATRWQIAKDSSFEWLILDVTIDASHTNNYLVNLLVPHGTLCSEQLYYWRASVKDAREGDPKWSNWSETFTFTTAAKVQADVNANAVADEEEPEYSDLDNDGLNDNDQPLMRVYKSREGQSLIGINALEGVNQINCFTSIDPESIPDEPRPKLKYGLMVFNVCIGTDRRHGKIRTVFTGKTSTPGPNGTSTIRSTGGTSFRSTATVTNIISKLLTAELAMRMEWSTALSSIPSA